MGRLKTPEIEDLSWCPDFVRNGVTDFLQSMQMVRCFYGVVIPRLRHALEESGSRCIVDLCSGAGGPWMQILQGLSSLDGQSWQLMLTDKFPNHQAARHLHAEASLPVHYCPSPVDALDVPQNMRGFRTLFGSLHHFSDDQARNILSDAVRHQEGIGVFEMTQRKPSNVISMFLLPLFFWMLAPWIRPFSWSRLFWGYVIPVLPLVLMVDGILSCLRSFSRAELIRLVRELPESNYCWEVGEERVGCWPFSVVYVVGVPAGQPALRETAEETLDRAHSLPLTANPEVG